MANRYFVGATDEDWNDTGNWSDSSGGSGGSSVPGSSDDVFFDDESPSCEIDVAASCKSIDCTGYTATLTLGANLTVSGNITLVSGMTFTPSTYTVIVSNTATITTGGKEFYGFTLSGYKAYAFADDVTVNGTFTYSSYASITGGNDLYCKGDIVGSASGSICDITATSSLTIHICGSGNQSINFSTDASYPIIVPVVIESTGGTVSFTNTTHRFNNSLTKTSGTVDFITNTSSVKLYTTKANYNFLSATLYNLELYGSAAAPSYAITFDGDVTVNNTLTITGYCKILGNNLITKGDVTSAGTIRAIWGGSTTTLKISGTGAQAVDLRSDASYYHDCPIVIDGSGTVTFANQTHNLGNNFTINGTATVNLNGTISFKTGTLTYTAGTVDAGTSTLSITGSCTLNTDGIDWYNITWSQSNTTTLSSALTATGLGKFSASTTFSGAYAISLGSLEGAANGITITNVNTMTVTGTATLGSAVSTVTYNGGNLYLQGNITSTATTKATGTTAVTINGSNAQAFSWTGSASYFYDLATTINKTGNTLTLSGVIPIGANWTWTQGTVDPGTSEIQIIENLTFDINNGFAFYKLTNAANEITTTLSSPITVNNTLSFGNGTFLVTWNGSTINAKGDVSASGTNIKATGTTALAINGTGTQTLSWTSTTPTSYFLDLATTINKTGEFVLSGTVPIGADFVVTAADTFTTASSTLKAVENLNFNGGSKTFNAFQVVSGTTTLTGSVTIGTVTIDSTKTLALGSNTLTVSGNLVNTGTLSTGAGKVIFAGTSTVSVGVAFYDMTINAGATVHLTAGQTFSVTHAFVVSGTAASPAVLDSTSAGTLVAFTVSGTRNVVYCNPTDIDSDGGSPIFDFGGTITTTNNWYTLTDVKLEPWVWGSGAVTEDTAEAQGGSGSCVKLNPSSTTAKLYWKFLIPCTNATPLTVKFYRKKSSSGANCTLSFSASGCGVTPVSNASVSLTDTYAEYTSTSLTPTSTGFVECILKAMDGDSTGDIYVDSVSIG